MSDRWQASGSRSTHRSAARPRSGSSRTIRSRSARSRTTRCHAPRGADGCRARAWRRGGAKRCHEARRGKAVDADGRDRRHGRMSPGWGRLSLKRRSTRVDNPHQEPVHGVKGKTAARRRRKTTGVLRGLLSLSTEPGYHQGPGVPGGLPRSWQSKKRDSRRTSQCCGSSASVFRPRRAALP